VGDRLFEDVGQALCAPHLIDVEITQVLRRFAADGSITDARAREALRDLADLPLMRYPHDILLDRMWDFRHNLTAYDAAYAALAEILPAPLVTCDRKLASAPRVEVLAELF